MTLLIHDVSMEMAMIYILLDIIMLIHVSLNQWQSFVKI